MADVCLKSNKDISCSVADMRSDHDATAQSALSATSGSEVEV